MKSEGVEMTEGGRSLRRIMMNDGKHERVTLMIMTGPHATAESRASKDSGFRKFSKPGKTWI